MSLLTLLRRRGGYSNKVLSTQRSALLAYWPLSEASGTTITDLSGNGRNGTYTGVDLGQTGIGDGRTAPYFDGVNDYGNVYSAALASGFNKDEGTAALWVKVNSAGIWSDGADHMALAITNDAVDSYLWIKKTAPATLSFTYRGGATIKTVTVGSQSSVGWLHLAMTWSKAADQMKVYINGVQGGSTQTGLGTWTGVLNSSRCVIGARLTTGDVWNGTIAHTAIWTTPLTAAQIASLAVV